jgi:hypothetical protein
MIKQSKGPSNVLTTAPRSITLEYTIDGTDINKNGIDKIPRLDSSAALIIGCHVSERTGT